MKNIISIRNAAATLIAIVAATISSFANAPSNDNFANAIDLGTERVVHVTSTNAEATKEPGEPNHAFNPGGSSIWFKWTAPSRRLAQISLVRSNFNTLMAVYLGTSLANLDMVASANDIGDFVQSAVRFHPEPGQTYYIAIDGATFPGQPVATGTVQLDIVPSLTRTSSDFGRDGRTDLAVFRPSDGTWYVLHSGSNRYEAIRWGMNGDIPVPGAYTTTENYTELSVFRPSTGMHYVLQTTETGVPMKTFQYGQAGDIPIQGNFLDSTATDISVFRPSNGTWYFLDSNAPEFNAEIPFGQAGDIPVPGDYSDDATTDIAVFRPSNGVWYIQTLEPSESGDIPFDVGAPHSIQFGQAGDKPVQGDYDGDGITDPAIFRPSDGYWWVLQSSNRVKRACPWGLGTDIPTPGDYDGDGKFDFAVFRPSNGMWYILQSSDNQLRAEHWGMNGDIPVTSNIR
jgi:hypothetical protein